ncbi:Imm61 family immunity protein [Mycobacteroides abscessus]|uniref:Imm61 family immunity protein n=1 Tax=Mycobacteroides abscessus TaxID=36809 RepID=UPI0009A1A7D8|nr:Imm61 family immunity protein [Mycobacteroides abscessus]
MSSVDLSRGLCEWARRAGYQVSQGSVCPDGRTVVWSGGGEIRIFIGQRPDGWFQMTDSERMQDEGFLLCAVSMDVVERFLYARFGSYIRAADFPLLNYPAAPLRDGWTTISVTLDGVRRLALIDPSKHSVAAVSADPITGNAQLAELSVCLSADLQELEESFLSPNGRPLFTTQEDIDEVPDFTADIDLDAALDSYLQDLREYGIDGAREGLVDTYGPAMALLIRSKIDKMLADTSGQVAGPLSPTASASSGARPGFSRKDVTGSSRDVPDGEMAVPIEADDLAELILTDDEANDEPWDSFVFFTYFGDRRTEESGFQYFETKWRPALVGSMELGERLQNLREATGQRDGRTWDAAAIAVDRASGRGRLFVFYGDDAEFWDITPATQKAVAERGLQLTEQL